MSMRQEPEFYALVDEPNAGEAYRATVSALYDPVVVNDPKRHRLRLDIAAAGSSLEEVLTVLGEPLRHGGGSIRIPFLTRSQRYLLDVILKIERLPDGSGSHHSLLSTKDADIMHQDFIVPSDFYVAAAHGELSVPVSAAILGHIWQGHLDQVFLAMCAPDAQSRVKMGVYNVLDKLYGIDLENGIGSIGWQAPLEMAATYHGNHEVARDLAFSWLDLHEHRPADSYVHLSLEELIMRVEAAPRGSSIGISSQMDHVVKHGLDESNACTLDFDQRTPLNCVAPRPRYPEDDELTREQVLATLQTPSETLLQALEAVAAVRDPEWREAEKRALEVLEVLDDPKELETSRWLRLDRFEQRCFLEAHGPFEVRRLHNGGVMLVAYPYRYLWPLWASALDLLGIRPKAS